MTFLSITRPLRGRARRFDWRISALTVASAVAFSGCSSASTGADASGEASQANDEPGDGDLTLAGGDGDGDGDAAIPANEGYGGLGGGSGREASCLTFMSWGRVALQGAVPGEDGMDAIVSWMNESSTASGEHYAEKPEITSEFLDGVELILLQDLGSWEFTQEEADLLEEWVRDGGGVMSLSGYSSDPSQVLTTNLLLSFTGMNYAVGSDSGGTSTNVGACGYCLGTTHQQMGWTDHPIADGVRAVGAYQGRSIQGDGEIVAQEEGSILGMAKQVDAGRVFLFHDEWVSYNTEWTADAPMECAENAMCAEASPSVSYQVPRFWLNAFSWLSGGRECLSVDGIEAGAAPKR